MDYILQQPAERRQLLQDIHEIIVANDQSVTPFTEPMMGKQMIVYKAKGVIKYGLVSLKNYMSLHVMPIYGAAHLYARYKTLLEKANFQKGCINFKNEADMPLGIVKQLIIDCASIDLLKIRQDYLDRKKVTTKK